MRSGGPRNLASFQHLFDEIDAAARPIEFVAQDLVCWARGIAKSAMYAATKNGVCLSDSRAQARGRIELELSLHLG